MTRAKLSSWLVYQMGKARLDLDIKIICSIDDHHKAEALFKALPRALDTLT